MKKLLVAIALSMSLITGLSAQEDLKTPSPLVVNYGFSFGTFPAPTTSDGFTELAQLFQTIASLRGGVEAQYTLPVVDGIGVGAGVGAYAMSLSTGSTQVNFLDLPLRAVAKFGLDTTFAEAYGGYYLSLLPFGEAQPLGGPEAGVRLALGGFYFEASMIWGTTTWTRYGFGFLSAYP